MVSGGVVRVVEFCEWWSDGNSGVKWSEMVNIEGVRWKKRNEGRY